MKIKFFSRLLPLIVLIVVMVIALFVVTGCNEEKAKDFGKLAIMAGEYQLASDADKPEKLDKLKESAVEFAKTYGKADAEALVLKLRDSGKINPDIAEWILAQTKKVGDSAAAGNTAVP